MSESRIGAGGLPSSTLLDAGLLPPGAELRRLATGATWSEGPLWMPGTGRVRWSDIPGDRILEVDPDGGDLVVHRTAVEFTNGRTLDASGAVVQCSHGRRSVELESADGEVTTLVDRWQGRRLNSPNDVVVARDGTIWFTDPPYGITQPREGHPGTREYGGCHVFHFDPVSGTLDAIVTDMEEPNGLAFSPDEGILYVSDTSQGLPDPGHIRAHRLEGGRVVESWIHARIDPGVSDGFRVDTEGRIWTSAGDGVHVIGSDGRELGRIPVPEVVANLCFGGADGRDLFIAATTSVYAIRTTVRDVARGAA